MLLGSQDGLHTMWRIELLHPMIVHWPIVVSALAVMFWIVARAGRWWPPLRVFRGPATILILLAAGSAWLAVLTGSWADSVVGRDLYDPRPLKDHENNAKLVSWLLVAAAVLELGRYLPRVPRRLRVGSAAFVLMLLLSIAGLMAWTAHLGASLVYQQGAGVVMPEADAKTDDAPTASP